MSKEVAVVKEVAQLPGNVLFSTPAVFKEPTPLFSKADWKQAESSRAWDFRTKFVKEYCWFIPTLETVQTLADFLKGKKVLEPGSGTGYLASHLRKLGVVDYTAVDYFSSQYWDTGVPNYGSIVGDALSYIKPEYEVIVLCWPPYAQPFGVEVVKRMSVGQILVLQGESWGGCTGDDDMHEMIDNRFVEDFEMGELLNDTHTRFWGINDQWSVYRCVSVDGAATHIAGELEHTE